MLGDTELLVQSIGSLLIVLAILLVMVFASRWFMQRGPQGGRRLRFLEAMALGNRDKLLLIEVDGQQLLLGITSHNISLLTKLDSKQGAPHSLKPLSEPQHSTPQVAHPSFSKTFFKMFVRHIKAEKPKDSL